MKRALLTFGLLIGCVAFFCGCDSDKTTNPVDENVPKTDIKQGESVNPEDLDLFKDDPPKDDDSKTDEDAKKGDPADGDDKAG